METARSQRQMFLAEINKNLPRNIDWKRGAVEYCRNLMAQEGEHNQRYHLIKPFVGGPDYRPFFVELYFFLNTLQKLNVPMGSSFLDVGCGPGWVAHFLGKLGHRVLGIDISADFIEVARTRVRSDPYPPHTDRPFDVQFYVHDIELHPLDTRVRFDVALFESTLHHFFDPVAAIDNVAASLKDNGVIAVIEAVAPQKGSPDYHKVTEIMEKYHTIERMYTRRQISELMDITGFTYRKFYYPVNGLFEQTLPQADGIRHLILTGADFNILIASRSATALARLGIAVDEADDETEPRGLVFGAGFYPQETRPDGTSFRWSSIHSTLELRAVRKLNLVISTLFPDYRRGEQCIYVYCDGELHKTITLSPTAPRTHISVAKLESVSDLIFYSDSCFSPYWFGQPDPRLLSFMLELEETQVSFQK